MENLSLLAFGFGPMELGIVAVICLLLFGNRLPGAMRGLGLGFNGFKEGLNGIEQDAEEARP